MATAGNNDGSRPTAVDPAEPAFNGGENEGKRLFTWNCPALPRGGWGAWLCAWRERGRARIGNSHKERQPRPTLAAGGAGTQAEKKNAHPQGVCKTQKVWIETNLQNAWD